MKNILGRDKITRSVRYMKYRSFESFAWHIRGICFDMIFAKSNVFMIVLTLSENIIKDSKIEHVADKSNNRISNTKLSFLIW